MVISPRWAFDPAVTVGAVTPPHPTPSAKSAATAAVPMLPDSRPPAVVEVPCGCAMASSSARLREDVAARAVLELRKTDARVHDHHGRTATDGGCRHVVRAETRKALDTHAVGRCAL